jgi:hypothetical protein
MIMIKIKITNPIKLSELIEKTGRISLCTIGFAVSKRHCCFEQSSGFMCSGCTDSGEVQPQNSDGRVCCSGSKTSNCVSQKVALKGSA